MTTDEKLSELLVLVQQLVDGLNDGSLARKMADEFFNAPIPAMRDLYHCVAQGAKSAQVKE